MNLIESPTYLVFGICYLGGFVLLTILEILSLKFLKFANYPKHIWFPLLANFINLILVFILGIISVIVVFAGFLVGLGGGLAGGGADDAAPIFYTSLAIFLLTLILNCLNRFLLFWFFSIEKVWIGLIYSIITTIFSVLIFVCSVYIAFDFNSR